MVATVTENLYSVDPNWYVDTGAMDHITNDLKRLTTKEPYGGTNQVQVADGQVCQLLILEIPLLLDIPNLYF